MAQPGLGERLGRQLRTTLAQQDHGMAAALAFDEGVTLAEAGRRVDVPAEHHLLVGLQGADHLGVAPRRPQEADVLHGHDADGVERRGVDAECLT